MESERDEANLIEAARFGDTEALEVLVDTYMDDVFLYILQRVPEPLAAERVSEDVFRTMIKRLPSYRQTAEATFQDWLWLLADEQLAEGGPA